MRKNGGGGGVWCVVVVKGRVYQGSQAETWLVDGFIPVFSPE